MKPTKGIIPGDRASGDEIRKRIKEVVALNQLKASEAFRAGKEEDAWLHRAASLHFKRELAKHDKNMRSRFPGWEPKEEEGLK